MAGWDNAHVGSRPIPATMDCLIHEVGRGFCTTFQILNAWELAIARACYMHEDRVMEELSTMYEELLCSPGEKNGRA